MFSPSGLAWFGLVVAVSGLRDALADYVECLWGLRRLKARHETALNALYQGLRDYVQAHAVESDLRELVNRYFAETLGLSSSREHRILENSLKTAFRRLSRKRICADPQCQKSLDHYM